MSFRKDMTINERVFRQNINNGPSIVIHILSVINIYYYLPTCGIQITCGHFRKFTSVKEAFTASIGQPPSFCDTYTTRGELFHG